MKPSRMRPLLMKPAFIVPLLLLTTDLISTATDPPEQILRISWTRGPNLPQGFQDSDGGIIDGRLITVGGFCSGGLEEDNRRKPDRYPRGFLDKAWELRLDEVKAQWQSLPDFPGAPRQALSCAKVDDVLYFWGGFSYAEPYCYADGWCLSRAGGAWKWEPLPEFPWPINSAAMAVVDSKIYAFGGSDYNGEAFFTDSDRHGKISRLGARLLVLDTENLAAGWSELPQCPGTPRWVHTAAAHASKLYVIGGASGNFSKDGVNYGYCTIVDNWSYDIADQIWTQLPDLPISSGNFPRSSQNVYRDRYILLPGGYQYSYVLNPDGTVRQPYGEPSSRNIESGLYNDVFVYDIAENYFGTADPLPIDNNLPMTAVADDRIYLIGGETGGGVVEGEWYGHHPDLLLIGKISEKDSDVSQ